MSRATASLSAVRVVSFDLDDTFWDCAPAIAKAEQALLDWHRAKTPRITDAYDRASLLQFRADVRKLHPELCGCVTAIRLQGLRVLLRQFNYPEALAEEAFDVFYRARSNVVMYPWVVELLEELGQRFGLAAITNGNADLEHIGIASHFDRIYAANLDMKAKPDSDMFNRCIKHFGITAGELLHVGDNPVADVSGGLVAGVQTLWFNQHRLAWPGCEPGPHFEVSNLSEIVTMFH